MQTEGDLVNGPLKLNTASRRVWVGATEIHLADTEFRLMAALMKEPGTVMTHEHLLHAVWGQALWVSCSICGWPLPASAANSKRRGLKAA